MPSLDGKVAIVTGAGRGIGREHSLRSRARPAPRSWLTIWVALRRGRGRIRPPLSRSRTRSRPPEARRRRTTTTSRTSRGPRTWSSRRSGTSVVWTSWSTTPGILRDRMLVSMTEEEWDAVIAVHLKGHFAPTHHAATYWRERVEGGEADQRPGDQHFEPVRGLR